MRKLLISACLLGVRCRYDGACKPMDRLDEICRSFALVPVCPEQMGGLATPRCAAERRDGGVFTRDGRDVTENYCRGAEEALRLARLTGCRLALLKEKSPSCGCGRIYDGTYSRTLIRGNGVAADLLLQNGVRIWGETHLDELLREADADAQAEDAQ